MARPMVEINPLRGIRLKQILEEQKTSQKMLSEKTGISQQAISAMVNGKVSVTETTAQQVVKCFPEYRFEWLMAYDNDKTYPDKTDRILNEKCESESSKFKGIISMLNGLSVKVCYIHSNFTEQCEREKYVDSVYKSKAGQVLICRDYGDKGTTGFTFSGLQITYNGQTVEIDTKEYSLLENDICDYMKFQLYKLFEERTGKNGNHS